jgi:hypothetical protein
MLGCIVTLMLLVPQGATAPLPDTPQGKQVAGYIEAFNTGDDQTYLAMQEKRLHPDVLARRSPDERREMFRRMKADFGTLRVAQVLKSTAEEIQLAIPNAAGERAVFTFKFESAEPFRITGIAVEIDDGGAGALPDAPPW